MIYLLLIEIAISCLIVGYWFGWQKGKEETKKIYEKDLLVRAQ